MRYLIASLLLLFTVLSSALAQSTTPAQLKEMKDSADAGNPEYEVALASHYLHGDGVKKDEKEAYRLYSLAAAKDYPPAYYSLGYCFEHGIAVPKDQKRAFKLYLVAAKKGYALAIYAMGDCYGKGIGVSQDAQKAFEYYLIAADMNNAYAIYKVGKTYENVEPLGSGYEMALKYYYKLDSLKVEIQDDDPIMDLAYKGYAEAQYLVGMRDPTTEDAFYFFQAAANQKHHKSEYQLAQYYDFGYNMKPDPKKALEYYKLAAIGGYKEAEFELATLFETGRLVGTPDKNQATFWYQKAADDGITYANECLKRLSL